MNQLMAFPRLSAAPARVRLQEVRTLVESNPANLRELSEVSHPQAVPVPTGAPIASSEDITTLRSNVYADLSAWNLTQPVNARDSIEFDRTLGDSLLRNLHIVPADAGHSDTWSFLTLVVFPDIAWARFPTLHENRALGKQHRNVLRRVWDRHRVVGDLQMSATAPLGEDEMTGLFERSALARNTGLVRVLASMIMEHSPADRTTYARTLSKSAVAITGTYLLDVMDPREVRSLIEEMQVHTHQDGAAPIPASAQSRESAPVLVETPSPEVAPPAVTASHALEESPAPSRPVARVTGTRGSADLVQDFHNAMLNLCADLHRLTGERPRDLLAMIRSRGGVEAARHIVGTGRPSESLTAMWELGRPETTVEALVADQAYRGLFSEDLTQRAQSTLEQVFG